MKTLTLFLTSFFIVITLYSQRSFNKKYVRLNANSIEAQADLNAMEVAFDSIKKLDCSNGLSWYTQGAMHNIPNRINGDNELCPKYQTSADKLWGWADCTHNGTTEAGLHFLLWHRMYIWHLEKVVRKLSGKEDFALPYWNYGGYDISDNKIPAKLSTENSPLYEAARYSILNNGNPMMDNQIADIRLALRELKTNPVFIGNAGFSKKMEASPHGYMHNLIGGGYANPSESYYNQIYQRNNYSGLMAQVDSAGFDPVFWLHHSMVDRIWDSWLAIDNSHTNPTEDQLESQPWKYQFYEPDGSRITYTMSELYNKVYNMDYTYDNLLYEQDAIVASVEHKLLKKTAKIFDIQPKPKETIVWEQTIDRAIAGESFTHKITTKAAKKTHKLLKSSNKSIESATENSQLVLNLDIAVYKEPKDYYMVYLRYPNKEDQFIGMMTFFGVNHEHGDGTDHEHPLGEKGAKLNFSYFISDDLMSSNEPFEVYIKKNGIGDAKVTIEKISVTELK